MSAIHALLLPALLGSLQAAASPLPSTFPATGAAANSSTPTLTAMGRTTTVSAGQPAALELSIVVPPGYHVYKDMVSVDIVDAGPLSLGEPSLPAGLMQPDPAAPGMQREQYDFDAIIEVPVVNPPPPGSHAATFSVRYQACKDSLCLFPQTTEVVSTLTVTPPGGTAVTPTAGAPAR